MKKLVKINEEHVIKYTKEMQLKKININQRRKNIKITWYISEQKSTKRLCENERRKVCKSAKSICANQRILRNDHEQITNAWKLQKSTCENQLRKIVQLKSTQNISAFLINVECTHVKNYINDEIGENQRRKFDEIKDNQSKHI